MKILFNYSRCDFQRLRRNKIGQVLFDFPSNMKIQGLAHVLFCEPNSERVTRSLDSFFDPDEDQHLLTLDFLKLSERRSPTCEDDVGDVVPRLSTAVVLVLVVEELLVPGVLQVEGALAVGGQLVLVGAAAAQAAVVQRETVPLAVGHELRRRGTGGTRIRTLWSENTGPYQNQRSGGLSGTLVDLSCSHA